MGFDIKCKELAEAFLPEGATHQIAYVAQEIQDSIETALETLPCEHCEVYPCVCEEEGEGYKPSGFQYKPSGFEYKPVSGEESK